MIISFEPTVDPCGLEIVDRIDRRRCTLRTDRTVQPIRVPTSEFEFPVDRGGKIQAKSVELSHASAVYVRNQTGLVIDELTEGQTRTYPADRYCLDVSAPIKLFFVVYEPITITVTADAVKFEFEVPVDVFIGARSYHEKPAAMVTTSTKPRDIMAAVSTFGSALKTLTAERSFPTLRGHPPTIEIGDELHVPSAITRPDTGITLEVPEDLRSIFVVSTLAYYLGAEVVPGSEPQLVTESGFVHSLDHDNRGFVGEVERVMKQVFLLDCLTRTEGFYPVNLHERNKLEEGLDIDFKEIYALPIFDQLENYLAISYNLIQPRLPRWKMTTFIENEAENVEALPFVVDEMSIVRLSEKTESGENSSQTLINKISNQNINRDNGGERSNVKKSIYPVFNCPQKEDSLIKTWIGNQTLIGASKAVQEAFLNSIERSPKSGNIDIVVVCNDKSMSAERDLVDQIYGTRVSLPFSVSVYRELTAARLHEILKEDIDFLHYIGHIDERGFECNDGCLDTADLDSTGVDAFFLNACHSYKQGIGLINAGSIGGVVTLADVIDSGAKRVGGALAKLLNFGFPLGIAINIAKSRSVIGGHYLVVGKESLEVTQPEGGVPILITIEEQGRQEGENKYGLGITTYPTTGRGMGSLYFPHIKNNNEYHLVSGDIPPFEVKKPELTEFLLKGNAPLIKNGSLSWTDELYEFDLHQTF